MLLLVMMPITIFAQEFEFKANHFVVEELKNNSWEEVYSEKSNSVVELCYQRIEIKKLGNTEVFRIIYSYLPEDTSKTYEIYFRCRQLDGSKEKCTLKYNKLKNDIEVLYVEFTTRRFIYSTKKIPKNYVD